MEDDLNFFSKWKTTSILFKMEEDLNLFQNGIQTQFVFQNGRRPQFFSKWKTTSNFRFFWPVIMTKLCVLLLLNGTDVCLNISFFDCLIVRSDQAETKVQTTPLTMSFFSNEGLPLKVT